MQAISLLKELWSKDGLSTEGSWGSPLAWAEVVRGQLCRCFWWGTPVCPGKNGRKRARRWGRERETLGNGLALTWCSTEVNGGGKERLDEVLFRSSAHRPTPEHWPTNCGLQRESGIRNVFLSDWEVCKMKSEWVVIYFGSIQRQCQCGVSLIKKSVFYFFF